MMEESTRCKFCGSVNKREFIGDMSLRSPGLKNIDAPPVLVCPRLWVCLDCCTATFTVPEAELRLLVQRNADATDGLVLSLCGRRGGCD